MKAVITNNAIHILYFINIISNIDYKYNINVISNYIIVK